MARNRSIEVTHRNQGDAEIGLRRGEIGIELERSLEAPNRLGELALVVTDQPEAVVGEPIAGLGRERSLDRGGGFVELTTKTQRVAEVVVCLVLAGLDAR